MSRFYHPTKKVARYCHDLARFLLNEYGSLYLLLEDLSICSTYSSRCSSLHLCYWLEDRRIGYREIGGALFGGTDFWLHRCRRPVRPLWRYVLRCSCMGTYVDLIYVFLSAFSMGGFTCGSISCPTLWSAGSSTLERNTPFPPAYTTCHWTNIPKTFLRGLRVLRWWAYWLRCNRSSKLMLYHLL